MNEDSNVKTVIGTSIDTSDDSDYHMDQAAFHYVDKNTKVVYSERDLIEAFKAGVKWQREH